MGQGKGVRSKLPFHAVFQEDVKPLGMSLVEGHQGVGWGWPEGLKENSVQLTISITLCKAWMLQVSELTGICIRNIQCGYGWEQTGSNGEKVTRVGCLSGRRQGWKKRVIKMGGGNCKHRKTEK